MIKSRWCKILLSFSIILTMLYMNITIDFTALLGKDLFKKPFIHVGPEEAYATNLTYKLYINEDCYMVQNSCTNDTTLVMSDSNNYVIYLKADYSTLPFAADEIVSAYLKAYCYQAYSSADINMYDIYRVTSSWSESQGNNNSPSKTKLASYPPFSNSNTGWKAYSVTNDIKNSMTNSTAYPNNGWAYASTWGNILMYSSEWSDTNYRPYIEITYNKKPAITSVSPINNSQYAGVNVTPSITAADPNCDSMYDWMIFSYYIDGETSPRETINAQGPLASKTVNFAPINMGSLPEGNRSIRFVVEDSYNASDTRTSNFYLDKTPPSKPTISTEPTISNIRVTASASDNGVNLDPAPYRFYIGNLPVSGWCTSPYTTPSTSPLSANTIYSVKCDARDKVGNISTSDVIQECTYAELPNNLGAVALSTSEIEVTCTDGNPSYTKYQLQVKNTLTQQIKYVTQEGDLTDSADASFTLTNDQIKIKGLQPDTPYLITVRAKNEQGDYTLWGGSATARTKVVPPGPPANITAQATSNTITLKWNPVIGAVSYDVLADGILKPGITLNTYTHTGLASNTEYDYKVRSRNSTEPGEWSTVVSKYTEAVIPSAPHNVKAVPDNTSISVTWDPLPNATGYQIMIDENADDVRNIGPSTNYIHSGLAPGTMHSYQVRALNAGGRSPWSLAVSATTLTDKPVIPSNIRAIPGKNQIMVSWDGRSGEKYEVIADGRTYTGITTSSFIHTGLQPDTEHTYTIRSNRNGDYSDWSTALTASTGMDVFGIPDNFKAIAADNMVELCWDTVSEATEYQVMVDGKTISNDTLTNCIHMGLLPGTLHKYKVRAMKVEVPSEWSDEISTTTFLLPAPQNFSGTVTQTAISLSWDTVNGAAGYDIEIDGSIIEGITDNTYASIGLKPGSQHNYRVRAVNSDGNSAWSIVLSKTLQSGSSNKPLLSALVKRNSITIMWDEISGATGYDLRVDNTTISGITDNYYVHSGLTPASIHTYDLIALGQGENEWSDPLPVKTLSALLDIPGNIEFSSSTDRVLVSWDGVENATAYVISINNGEEINVGSATSYLGTGLLPDTDYTYRVKATKGLESSPWSSNYIVKTKKATRSYTLDCLQDELFSFMFTAANLQDPSQYTFTVTYDSTKLEAVDLCASTPHLDTSTGIISGDQVRIVQYSPGTIVFKRITGDNGVLWSGMVNSIKFRSFTDGQTVIHYTTN
jgi:hypothetical protein